VGQWQSEGCCPSSFKCLLQKDLRHLLKAIASHRLQTFGTKGCRFESCRMSSSHSRFSAGPSEVPARARLSTVYLRSVYIVSPQEASPLALPEQAPPDRATRPVYKPGCKTTFPSTTRGSATFAAAFPVAVTSSFRSPRAL